MTRVLSKRVERSPGRGTGPRRRGDRRRSRWRRTSASAWPSSTACRAPCRDAAGRAARRRPGDGLPDLLRLPAVLRGCTADADVAAELFGDDDALTRYAMPARFGSRREMTAGIARALAAPGQPAPVRALQMVRGLPAAGQDVQAAHHRVLRGRGDADRPARPAPAVQGLFAHVAERWDGKGQPDRAGGEEIPLPMRIVHVARDAAFQRMLGRRRRRRGGGPRAGRGRLRPGHREPLADGAAGILAAAEDGSVWERRSRVEPRPWLDLEGEAIDRALAAMGDFADLASPYLVGHSAGVAELAAAAARRCGLDAAAVARVRRAALVHDLGRVAVPVRIWQKAGPLTPDDWERVRLHAYHSERVLARSPFLAAPAPRSPPSTTSGSTAPATTAGRPRRRSPAGRAAARRRRRLPRDDRAAAAPPGAVAGTGGRGARPARPAPGGSTPTRPPRCSRRPGSRPPGSSGRPG